MIDAKTAYKIFRREHPDRKVFSMCDYNKKYYVITASNENGSIDFNGSEYAIDKKNGEISVYNPLEDIGYFMKVSYERKIDISSFE